PVDIDWTAGRLGGLNPDACEKLFQEFGFRGLTEKVVSLGERQHVPQAWEADYQLVSTRQGLDELVARLQQQSLLSVDLETTHRSPRWAEIVGYAFAFEPGEAYYVAVRGPQGETELDPQETLEQLRPILENPQIKKLGQNLKYDSIVLRSAGVGLQGVAFDTMVASYLLDAGGRNHDLDYLAKTYLKHDNTKITELIGTGKNQKRMDEVPCEQVAAYAGEDADVPLRLYPLLAERLAQGGLDKLFHELEVPLIDVLVELEFNGIRVDIPRLRELSAKFGARLDALELEIYELAGREFNINSPKQLGEILYQEQKLPVTKRTKSGPSTDAGVLEELARSHPLPRKIIEYRQYAKLKNTYVDALPQLVFPQTQRVHASFNQVVAATGRLSSSDPNLQNIPIRTETGREIRSAFLPEEGWTLVAADYSQIELRVLAHFCQDPTLRQAFAADEDIHALVASQVYDVPLTQVTPEMRRNAKGVNFGVIYGQSSFG
ncbi:MAG: DNA polymerase, partial [Pirellulales bacterium]